MKINTTFLIVGLFFIVLLSSIVVAESDNPSVISVKNNNSLENNATFGQCVSENADIKNVCYKSAKEVKTACKLEASNQTDYKPALRNCISQYKQDKNQCKFDFKSAKKECAKIKHNFFDKVKTGFK